MEHVSLGHIAEADILEFDFARTGLQWQTRGFLRTGLEQADGAIQ